MKPHNTCSGQVDVTARLNSTRRVIEYLFDASDTSLGHFELAHLNLAANFRKDFVDFLDMLVQELAEARAAAMIREGRAQHNQAGIVFLALLLLLWQHEQRVSRVAGEPSLSGHRSAQMVPESSKAGDRSPSNQDSGGARSTEKDTTGTLSPLSPRRLTARNARGAARKRNKA